MDCADVFREPEVTGARAVLKETACRSFSMPGQGGGLAKAKASWP
jgi:hypothetical protein